MFTSPRTSNQNITGTKWFHPAVTLRIRQNYHRIMFICYNCVENIQWVGSFTPSVSTDDMLTEYIRDSVNGGFIWTGLWLWTNTVLVVLIQFESNLNEECLTRRLTSSSETRVQTADSRFSVFIKKIGVKYLVSWHFVSLFCWLNSVLIAFTSPSWNYGSVSTSISSGGSEWCQEAGRAGPASRLAC